MLEKKIVIIVHVNEKYKDVSDIFFKLFKRYWSDCPFKVVVSYKGILFKDYGYESYISNSNATLPTDVYNIMNLHDSKYCISFLGDAFITSMIDSEKVLNSIMLMEKHSVKYCRLFNSANSTKEFGPISQNEMYGVSFIAFIAEKNFVKSEFLNKSDLEFEKKFLRISISRYNTDIEWKYFYALPNEVFGIVHGVVKGVWVRKSYNIICRILQNKNIGEREIMGTLDDFLYKIRLNARKYKITSYIRKQIINNCN